MTRNFDASCCCSGSARSLGAAFPLGAAAEPVANGGEEGCVAVERSGEGQGERPKRRAIVELHREEKRHRQEGSGGAAEKPGGIFAGEKKNPRQPVGDKEAEQGGDEQHRGIMKLGEGGARDEVANFGEGFVLAKTDAGTRDAHPDFPAGSFYSTGESAIINHFVSNGCKSTDVFKRSTPQQNASARGTGGSLLRIRNPTRWIEHQEKIQKRRNQQFLRESLCLQEHHERGKVERFRFGAGDQALQRVRRVYDIGVGKPEKARGLFRCDGDSFVKRPKFPGPALRKFRCGVDNDSLCRTGLFRGFPRE